MSKGIKIIKDSLSKNKTGLTIITVMIAVLMVSGCLSNPVSHSPGSFLYISNWDDSDHQLHVEIYNSDNEIVINNTYEIKAGNSTRHEERYPSGEYRVNVTLDNNLTVEETVDVPDEFATIDVTIHDENHTGYYERVSFGVSTP